MCAAAYAWVCSLTLAYDFRHLQSPSNKAFQHVKVDTLCQPEVVSSVAVPGQWSSTKEQSNIQYELFIYVLLSFLMEGAENRHQWICEEKYCTYKNCKD